MDYLNFPYNELVFNILLIVLSIWSIAWKGLALWRSARNKQTYWFAAILVINLFGILEIVYLFKYAKEKMTISELTSLIRYFSIPKKSSK